MASATDELSLLERVFFRIGSADTDEQLQSAVSKFLPPVLLKLSSQQDGVRKKVMELLVHINKRIKTRPTIQLPVEALLLQYQDPSASSFVTNFTIIYVKMGYPRLPIAKQAELVPCVLNALEGKPQGHQDSLLLILMPVLGHVVVPDDPKKRSVLFGLNERPHVTKQLADFMLDLLLLPYGATTQQEQVPQLSQQQAPSTSQHQASSTSQPAVSSNSTSSVAFPVPLGMSEYSFKRVTGETPMKPEELEQAKLGVVKFLAGGVMADSDILCHLVVAAADTRFSVANAADIELKKIVGLLDWGSPALTVPLFELFLGTQLLATKARPIMTKLELQRQPAGTRIRLKILPHLCRARGPALMFPACIQVFFDALYGANTNPRLKNMALQFCLLIILGSNLSRLIPVAGVLLSGLLKLISDEEASLKALAYSAAGKLGHRIPHLVNKDLALLQAFLEALSQENTEVRMSVREALLSMVDAFRTALEDTVAGSSRYLMMEALIAIYIESSEPMARFVAVRYASTVFPANHSPSRYLLLLACGDSKDEVSTEALKSLYNNYRSLQDLEKSSSSSSVLSKDGGSDEDLKSLLPLPSFGDMVNCVSEKAEARMQNMAMRHIVGNHSLPFSLTTFTEVLLYLHLCLGRDAKVPVSREVTFQQQPSQWTPLVGRYLHSLCETDAGRITTECYLRLIQKLVTVNISVIPFSCLLEAVGSAPELLATKLVEKLNWLRSFLTSTKEKIREASALLYAIVIAHELPDQQFDEAIQDLVISIKGKNLEVQHGCTLALAHALERRLTLLKKSGKTDHLGSWPAYHQGVNTIVSLLSHHHVLLVGAACTGVGELARCYPLPLPEGSSEAPLGKLDLVKKLQEIVSNTKFTSKVKERAALATGLLCVGEHFPHSRDIIQGFLDMAKETRDVEVHLTSGEALVCCVQGVGSPQGRDAWTTLEAEYEPPSDTTRAGAEDLGWLLDQLLNKLAPDPHPNSRQASCIWLLTILKHCPHREEVKQQLEAMQKTFMDFLSENSDIVQDVASKGLGLVYESSDEESRSKLVGGLLEQLTSGRRAVTQVSSETELFEEGQLGKSPSGGNLSTYKELCSLASDLNQPDLIYQFMQLANHNSIWNSKKGAAFGFSTIAASAGEQLSEYLPKIVPRLYRYQYDPTPRIQMSMSSIWRALVSEPQKTVDLYHAEILTDLVTNLTSPQWRVRTSCCLALSDFLRGGNKTLHDCLGSLPQLWTQLFRVMDDVHEGTRQAATATTRVLSMLTVRCSDANQGKAGEEIVRTVLPVLLQDGICNTVSEVRAISLQCVSQLVGSAGVLLKPHLTLLIPALLEATSELELHGLSQLSVQFGGEQQTQEKIDSLRASAAKSHYTTETVAKCVQYVDASILDQLVPRVLELMRGSVGLGTRVAIAHFLVLLVAQLKLEMKPFTGKILLVLVNGLTDRNAAVRKNYAITIGHMVSVAKDSSIEKLFVKLQTWYFEKEDESVRSALAYTIQAIGHYNQDVLKECASVVLPLAFFAMHAPKLPERSSVEVWEDIWQEATPGTERGVRQYAFEICSLLKEALESPSWTMKAQAASAIVTVAIKIGPTMDVDCCNELISILVSGLNGRTWNGKENLLLALATICTSCSEALKHEDYSAMVDTVMKECLKVEPVYKRHALQALGNILAALEVDRFDVVYTIIQDTQAEGLLENGTSEEDRDVRLSSKKQENLLQLREVGYETLGKAWPTNAETQFLYREEVVNKCVSCLARSTRSIQVAIMGALWCFIQRLQLLELSGASTEDDQAALSRIVEQVSKALMYALGIVQHTKLRKEALNVLYLLVKKLIDANQTETLQTLSETFGKLLEEASQDNAPEIKSRVVDIKNIMKS